MSKNRILPLEAILSKSGESWVVGGVASNFFRDLDGDAIAPDAIARAIPAFMANRGPDGLKGGPLRLHHGFWERFLKQSINSLNIPYADQMGMLAAIALPLGRVTEMTVEPDGTTRWRGLLSQANPIAKVIWEMLKEGLVHLGVSVGGKINATRPGRDALGRPCTVICDVRLDELSITDNPANRLIESEAADNGAYIMALAKSLQTTVSSSPVDQFLEQVLDDDLSKAARKKMQEGATRMKNGQQQVLKNSRWRNVESGNSGQKNAHAKAKASTRKPRAKAAPQQLSLIPDGTPSKLKPKAQKGKQWGAAQQPQAPAAVGGAAMGVSTLRPKKKGKRKAEPSLKELFDQADAIGSKYQDENDPVDLDAARKAKEIVDGAGMGKAKNKAKGVADLSAKRDQKAKGEGRQKNNSFDDAVRRMVSTGNHTEASAKAALEWASQPREGAEMEIKKNILRQAGLPVPGESFAGSRSSTPSSSEFLSAFSQVESTVKSDNYLPMHKLRAAFPDLSRDDFDQMMFALERADIIEMSHLQEVRSYTPKEREQAVKQPSFSFEDSWTSDENPYGGALFFASLTDKGQQMLSSAPNPDKPAPVGDDDIFEKPKAKGKAKNEAHVKATVNRPDFDVVGDPVKLPRGTVFWEDATPEQRNWMERVGQDYMKPYYGTKAEIRQLFPDIAATARLARSQGFKGDSDIEVLGRYTATGIGFPEVNFWPFRWDDDDDTSLGGTNAPQPSAPAAVGASELATKGEAKPKRSRKAKAEGGDTPPEAKGGGLAVIPKKADKNRSRRTKQGDIDEQYASAAPTEDHVQGWLQASMENYLNPPMRDLEAEVIHEQKTMETGNLANPDSIHTLDQLADALTANEQRYKATYFKDKEMRPEDMGLWEPDREKQLKTAERQMKTGRTDASRAKAQKTFERLSAAKKEAEEAGAAAAARMNAKHSTPPEQRRAEILQELKGEAQKKLSERHALQNNVKRGRQSAINDVQRAILNKIPTFRQHVMDGKVDLQAHARNPLEHGREAIKEHLQQAHQKNGGDREILGLQSGKPTAHELKQAYRQSARAHHPDHGGSREKFDQVRAAYERMMDDHYPDLKKSLIPYIPKNTMAKVNRFLRKALEGSPGGEINSGSWRDTAIPSMGRGLAANPTTKPTGTKPVRLDASSSDTAARGIGGKQPKAQRPYSSGGMPPTDVWGMTVGQLTRELSKCCEMGKEAWGSPETSGFLTDAAHGLVGLTESPNPELINFVRFLQYMNQFAQQLPHMDDYQAAGTVAAMNTDLTKALGDFTAALPAELKGRPLRPPGSPGVRGIDIQFPSQYIVYS